MLVALVLFFSLGDSEYQKENFNFYGFEGNAGLLKEFKSISELEEQEVLPSLHRC